MVVDLIAWYEAVTLKEAFGGVYIYWGVLEVCPVASLDEVHLELSNTIVRA